MTMTQEDAQQIATAHPYDAKCKDCIWLWDDGYPESCDSVYLDGCYFCTVDPKPFKGDDVCARRHPDDPGCRFWKPYIGPGIDAKDVQKAQDALFLPSGASDVSWKTWTYFRRGCM